MSIGISNSMVVRQFTDYKNYLEQNEDMSKFKKVKKKLKSRRDNFVVSQKKLGNILDEQNTIETKDILRQFTFHQMNLNQLAKSLHTDINAGLNQDLAQEKLKEEGENKLPQAQKTNNALLFLLQMSDPFSLFIWGIVCLCVVLFGVRSFDVSTMLLAIILIISTVGGAIISFMYSRRTEDTLIQFTSLIPQFCNVIRQSKLQLINASQLVSGDIIQLGPGDKIPADCRAIQSFGLHINNSLLTGQSDGIKVSIQPAFKSTHVLDCSNMLFAGCLIVQGQGKALVVGTGQRTVIAQITNHLIKQQKISKSTLMQTEITRYVAIMTIWSVFMFVIVLIVAPINGFAVVIAFQMGVGVMVASCPSVLNLVLIVLMTHVVRRLSKQNMIVKNFYNLEALGATTCLCTDKTGTITINNMSVSNIYYNGAYHKADSYLKGKNFNYQYDIEDYTFRQIQKCAVLSSVAKFVNSPPKSVMAQLYSDKKLSITQKHIKQKQLRSSYLDLNPNTKQNSFTGNIVGDPTQSALIRFFNPIESITKMRAKFPIQKNKKENQLWLPFNSNRKYSLSIHQQESNKSKYCAYTKGAPQKILEMCTHVMMADGKEQVITEQMREELINVHKLFTHKGERVIAYAKQYEKHDDPSSIILNKTNMEFYEQVFLGYTSFNDPPRPGITNAITRLRVAGIKVIMITGDHAQTAQTIARETNIVRQPKTVNQLMEQNSRKRQKNNKIPQLSLQQAKKFSQAIIVTGDQLVKIKVQEQGLPESQKGAKLRSILEMQQIVFARATPAQKLEIVQMLQKMGHVVTVTGDGVNDSPAIKRADVGICMFSGSDASRQAADVVLTDDNLYTIVDGIKQGRRMFDNMKKTICYVMTSQVSQFVPFLILISLRIPIPIFTLLIDGIVDLVPSISLAYQEAEEGIMTRSPRDRTQHLVNVKLLAQCSGWMGLSGFLACFLNYWICMNDFGFDINHLWKKSNIPVVVPEYTDTYNPSNPYFGNTNLEKIKNCEQFDEIHSTTDWINAEVPWMDLRMSAVLCQEDDNGKPIFTQNMVFSQCIVQQISVFTNRPICYTTQATKYGQTSYMMGNVVDQIFNLFICKTRRESVFTQGMNNRMMWIGLTLQYLLTIFLTQFYWMIFLIGTRDLLFIHFGIASVPVGMAQFVCDEIRKFLIRNLPKQRLSTQKQEYKPNWFQRNTLW